jgi:hypothetical protein
MKLKELALEDKPLFDNFLKLAEHELSGYSFCGIYVWKRLFHVLWCVIEENLCVFFQDDTGSFACLPPLGKNVTCAVVEKIFGYLDSENKSRDVSRIENIEESAVRFYKENGYICREKFPEYLCETASLVALRGRAYKHKRACCNFFEKNYDFAFTPFEPAYKKKALDLFDLWSRQRPEKHNDKLYSGMIKDSLSAFNQLLDDFRRLQAQGYVLSVKGNVIGATFGFPVSGKIFCVLFEITDLSVKGAAQYIFREFCRKVSGFEYINIMDDSGLENLRKVKLSYRPRAKVKSFIVTRA